MSGNTGRRLEALVAFVERVLTPAGCSIEVNTHVRDEETNVVIAEFDIRVRGRLGTTEIDWLIECRDRPGSGPAPASWIEQLIGRRTRFHFDKVTAVSTTGFSAPATKLANEQKIELREVKSLELEEFGWLKASYITIGGWHLHVVKGTIIPNPRQAKKLLLAVAVAIEGRQLVDPILRLEDGSMVSPTQEFARVLNLNPQCVEDVRPNDPPKAIAIRVNYEPEADQFTINTQAGPVRISAIEFEGTYHLTERQSPITDTSRYSRVESGEPIADVATYEFTVNNHDIVFQMQRLKATDETLVVVRKTPVNQEPDL